MKRGEEWCVTLHLSQPTLHLDIFSSDYAELTEHSCSTDYAQILNGRSTCSVFEEGHADLAFPSAADFQFTDFPGEEW